MGNQFGLNCFLALAITCSLQPKIFAQVESNKSTDSTVNLTSRLSSPWSDAVLTHTLESATEINLLEFSPDGKILAAVEADQITLWKTDKGEVQQILPSHQAKKHNLKIAPTAIAFSPDSQFLATATWSQGLLSPDRSIIVWDAATGKEVLSLADSAGCRQVLFDVKGEILYGACDLGVTAWSFPQGDKLFSFDLEYPVEAIALSPDGKVMATVDANITGGQQGEQSNQIQLWALDREKPALLNTLDGHANDIAQVEFTSDGKKLVSSSYDGKINVTNWHTGKVNARTNNIYSRNGLFSLNADSSLIAGNFYSSAMTSLVTGLPLKNVLTSDKKPKLVAFSPQGQLFAIQRSTDSNQNQIYLWRNNPLSSYKDSL